MKTQRAEFHIHTTLSPCAEVEMIPPLIIQEALEKGINWIAITDHNASANVQALIKAAGESGVAVTPGMEIQTREEVHALCLFDELDQLVQFQKLVDAALPDIKNNPDYFGEQFVVDDTGDFIRREDRLLLTSVSLTLQEAWMHVEKLGGLFIPAHVNRKAFGLFELLGFLPEDIQVEALEISRHVSPQDARRQFPQIGDLPLIQSGDAHLLQDILGRNEFVIEKPTIAELKLAFNGMEGRSFQVLAG